MRQTADELDRRQRRFHDAMLLANSGRCRDISCCRFCSTPRYVCEVQRPVGSTPVVLLEWIEAAAQQVGAARYEFDQWQGEIVIRYRVASAPDLAGGREGRLTYWYRNGDYSRALTRKEAEDRIAKSDQLQAVRA